MSRRGKRRQVVQLDASSSNLHHYGYSKSLTSMDKAVSNLKLVGDYSDSESDDDEGDVEKSPSIADSETGPVGADGDSASTSENLPTTEIEKMEASDEKVPGSMDDELRNFLSEIEAIPMPPDLQNVAAPSSNQASPLATPSQGPSRDPSPGPNAREESPESGTEQSMTTIPVKKAEPEKKKKNMYSMFVKGDTEFSNPSDRKADGQSDTAKMEEEVLDFPEEPTSLWQLVQDEATQYYYYWNWHTNQVTWEIPDDYTRYLLLHKEYEAKLAKYSPEQIEAAKEKQRRLKKGAATDDSKRAAKEGSATSHIIGPQLPNGSVGAVHGDDQDDISQSGSVKKKKSHKKHKKRRHKEEDHDTEDERKEGLKKNSTHETESHKHLPKPLLSSIVPYLSDDEIDTTEDSALKQDDAISQKDLTANSAPVSPKKNLEDDVKPHLVVESTTIDIFEQSPVRKDTESPEDQSNILSAKEISPPDELTSCTKSTISHREDEPSCKNEDIFDELKKSPENVLNLDHYDLCSDSQDGLYSRTEMDKDEETMDVTVEQSDNIDGGNCEETKQIVSLEETKQIVSDNSDSDNDEETKQIVSPEETKQIVSLEETKQIVSPEETKQIVSPEETKQIVSPEETEQIVSPEETKQIVSLEETKQIVSPEETEQIVSPEEIKNIASPEETKQIVSHEEIKNIVSPEETKQIVSHEEIKNIISPEETKQIVSHEEIKNIVSPEETKQIVSPEEEREITPPENTKEIISPEETKQIISPEDTPIFVTENGRMEVEEGEISDSNDLALKRSEVGKMEVNSTSGAYEKFCSSSKGSLQETKGAGNLLNLIGYKSDEDDEEEEGELREETISQKRKMEKTNREDSSERIVSSNSKPKDERRKNKLKSQSSDKRSQPSVLKDTPSTYSNKRRGSSDSKEIKTSHSEKRSKYYNSKEAKTSHLEKHSKSSDSKEAKTSHLEKHSKSLDSKEMKTSQLEKHTKSSDSKEMKTSQLEKHSKSCDSKDGKTSHYEKQGGSSDLKETLSDLKGVGDQLPEKTDTSRVVDEADIDFDDIEDIDRVLEMVLEKKMDKKKVEEAVDQQKQPISGLDNNGLESSRKENGPEMSGDAQENSGPNINKHSHDHHASMESEQLETKMVAMADLAFNKLDFLEVGANSLSKLQVLYVELQTRLKDWKDGGLSTDYFYKQLQQAEGVLEQYEVNAVPDGWLCQWDRVKCRYFYRNSLTGDVQLEYPEIEVEAKTDTKGGKKDGGERRRREKESSEVEDGHKQHSSSSRSSRHRRKDDKDRSKHDRRSSDRHRKKRRRRRAHSSSSESSNETSHQHHHKSKRKKKRKTDRSPSVEVIEDGDDEEAPHVIEDSPPSVPSISASLLIHDENSIDSINTNAQTEPLAVSVQPTSSQAYHRLAADYLSDSEEDKMDGEEKEGVPLSPKDSEIDGMKIDEEEEEKMEEENSTAVISKPPQLIVPPHVAALNPPELYSTFAPGNTISATPSALPLPTTTTNENTEELPLKGDDGDKTGKKKKKEKAGKEKTLSTGSSLMMKKKRVSSMVQKWQQVKKEVEKEDLAKELRQAAIREQINQLK